MRVDGKEILTDEELGWIIDRNQSRAIGLIRYRLGVSLPHAIAIVAETILELGIGRMGESWSMAVYNEEPPA